MRSDIENYIALHSSTTLDSVTPAPSVVSSLNMHLKTLIKAQINCFGNCQYLKNLGFVFGFDT